MMAGLLTCSVCCGQPILIGVIGGEMVSNDLNNQWLQSVSTRYAIGPKLDIGLPFGLGIEVDMLYRNQGYQLPDYPEYSEQHATSWEFPFLLKKSLAFPLVKPFAEAGYAPRVLDANGGSTASHGLVLGGGVELGIGRLRLEPAIRYTHWRNTPVLLVIPNGPSPQLSANQVDVLLGISLKLFKLK